jgi:hypothetical protein
VEIPIACTLESGAAQQRVDRWRQVFSVAVARTERVTPGRLSCGLKADLADLQALVFLAQEEKACCPFFSFSLEIEADSLTLVVEVPDDAVTVLDQFAALTGPA